jgi:toxin-antitoxin system PIN domain toxin
VSVYLLDVNVLVALLWTNHEHHQLARAWFTTHHRSGWATCPLTQAGFVRVSSNPRVFPDAPAPSKVVEVLESNLKHPAHRFFKDEIGLARAVQPFEDRFSGHQQTTDAYLFGLAIHQKAVLATFDKSVAALVGQGSIHLKRLEVLST